MDVHRRLALRIALAVVILTIAVMLVLRFRSSSELAIRPIGHAESLEEGDEAVLRALQERGSDLTKATDIINYLYIPSLADAQNIEAHLTRGGYQVEVREPLERLSDGTVESSYSVLIHITELPNIANIRKMRQLMDTLADRFDGRYDGWEAQIQA